MLQPNYTKHEFSIFQLIFLPCIFFTIGLMIAIKMKHQTENDINQQGPKNLDSFWLNSVFASVAIYSFVFVMYLKG